MGIISAEAFNREVKDSLVPERVTLKVQKVIDTPGRKEGDVNVPNGLRNLIGATAVEDSRQDALELAASFGISPSSVSAYSNGSTSTDSYDKRPNAPVIDGAKQRVSKRARTVLLRAINHLTDEKLSAAKAGEIASVAKSMSSIMTDMEPKKEDRDREDDNKRPIFIVHAPTLNQENHYETIVAKEG